MFFLLKRGVSLFPFMHDLCERLGTHTAISRVDLVRLSTALSEEG